MNNQPNQTGLLASRDEKIQDLRFQLFQSCSWLSSLSRSVLDPFGITPKQFNILSTLAARSPESLSIQEVRDSLADKMSDASRLIDRLDKKGLLEKFPSDFDRRSNRTRITASGLKLVNKISKNGAQVNQEISDRLSDEQINQLTELLGHLK